METQHNNHTENGGWTFDGWKIGESLLTGRDMITGAFRHAARKISYPVSPEMVADWNSRQCDHGDGSTMPVIPRHVIQQAAKAAVPAL